MSLLDAFLAEVETYIEAREHITATTFGREAVGDPNFVFDLRTGRAPRITTIDQVRQYMTAEPAE